MAQQTINVGTSPNDGTGTPLRTAFQYTNSNFTELYTALGGGAGLPGASSQVIFNNGTNLAGNAGLIFNTALSKLVAANLESTASLVVGTTATITGDLTVDTSTLKVDSANNRVGIGTASPGFTLDILGSSGVGVRIYESSTGNNNRLQITQEGTETRFNSTYASGSAFYTWQIASSEQMRLNSTGLGVGMVPQYKLQVGSTTYSSIGLNIASVTDTACIFKGTPDAVGYEYAKIVSGRESSPFTYGSFLAFYTEGKNSGTTDTSTERLRIDSSGNVGIGVTPSAWNTYKAVSVGGIGATVFGLGSSQAGVAQGAYFNNGAGSGWAYSATSQVPTYYLQVDGENIWSIASSGTAGTQIASWTQAMKLDASGNLLVASTSTSLTTGTGLKILQNSGVTTVGTVGSSSSDVDTTYRLYSSTASAYRFYVGYGGTVYATNTTISAISDARLKENVQDIDVGLGAILALKPRKFDWKEGKGKNIKGDRGFIAQEFEQVFPQLVDEWADPAPEGEAPYKSVRQDLIPVLVKAIQELAAEVNALKNA